MNKYFVNIAGGGIRLYAILVGFLRLMALGVIPTVLSGVSAGAIVVFLYYCVKLQTGKILSAQSHDRRIIFSKKGDPIGKVKGISIWAIYRLLKKRNHLGKMDNLEANLRSIVTKTHWDNIQAVGGKIDCYIHCIDLPTKKKHSFNLRHLSYEQAISVVIGSASIVPFVPPREVSINGEKLKLVDGGFRDSSAGSHLLETGIVKPSMFDECITIWSRTDVEDYTETNAESVSNALKVAAAVISMMMREIAVNDEKLEKELCDNLGKTYSPIHLGIKTSGVFDITKEELQISEIQAERVIDEYMSNR